MAPKGPEPSSAHLLHPLSLGNWLSPWSLVASCSGEFPCPLHGFALAYLRCFHGKDGMGHAEESSPDQKMKGHGCTLLAYGEKISSPSHPSISGDGPQVMIDASHATVHWPCHGKGP